MAAATTSEMLTTEEVLALQSAWDNPHYRAAMEKIFSFDRKFHVETMENAALSPVVNTNLVIASASQARYAKEIFGTIQRRLDALTVKR